MNFQKIHSINESLNYNTSIQVFGDVSAEKYTEKFFFFLFFFFFFFFFLCPLFGLGGLQPPQAEVPRLGV